MVPRRHNLLQVLLHLLPAIHMRKRQRRKPDDRIHRRADVMRHIRKEHALRLAGPVRLQKRILQQILLLHLAADLLVHTAKPQHNAVILLPVVRPHRLHLEILHLSVQDHAVIHIMLLLPRKLPP